MDYMPFELPNLIKDKMLTEADIKDIMFQLLSAAEFMHKLWVIHRDISISNILVNKDGDIILADFGQSRYHGSPRRKLSQGICTIFYRAPELLFGARYYSSPVDIWAIGCIFYELITGKPLFTG